MSITGNELQAAIYKLLIFFKISLDQLLRLCITNDFSKTMMKNKPCVNYSAVKAIHKKNLQGLKVTIDLTAWKEQVLSENLFIYQEFPEKKKSPFQEEIFSVFSLF